METISLKGEEGLDADESPPVLADNYEQTKYEFVTEIDDIVFEIEKCLQELDLIADEIANDLLEWGGVIPGVQVFDQISESGYGLLDIQQGQRDAADSFDLSDCVLSHTGVA